eukprot:1406220-Rhodomonas_salina.1
MSGTDVEYISIRYLLRASYTAYGTDVECRLSLSQTRFLCHARILCYLLRAPRLMPGTDMRWAATTDSAALLRSLDPIGLGLPDIWAVLHTPVAQCA